VIGKKQNGSEVAYKIGGADYLHAVFVHLLLGIAEKTHLHFIYSLLGGIGDAHSGVFLFKADHIPFLCVAEAFSAREKVYALEYISLSLSIISVKNIYSLAKGKRIFFYVSEVFKNSAFEIHF
jgi:hypothetical protein